MDRVVEEIKRCPGVKSVAVLDRDGMTVAGSEEDIFVILIPFLEKLKENIQYLGGTLEELILNKGKDKVLIKEWDGVFFCVLYSPEDGGYDGRVKHHTEKAIRSIMKELAR